MEPNIKTLGHKRNDTKHKLDGVVSKLTLLASPKHVLTGGEIAELKLIKERLVELLSKENWNEGTEILGLKTKKV